ncbi:hypothetical protein [Prochlorococcus marinus]|nr:hypothetical protein [Prochlorococcus marinus]
MSQQSDDDVQSELFPKNMWKISFSTMLKFGDFLSIAICALLVIEA